MKIKRKLIASILVLALVATAFAVVSAQLNSSGSAPMGVGRRLGGPCGMSQLTDEEREEIQQQLQEYKQNLLEQYGIDLTEEQREEIRQAMQEQQQEMRQQMEEFRQELLEQYGIDLTDEEREEIRQQMEEYRQELFEQYGINLTEGQAPMGVGGRPDDPCGMSQLTDEEREEIREQMEEYRQELFEQYGTDVTDEEREEMRQQMQEFQQELFEQYGISCPEGSQFAYGGGKGPRGRMGPGMQGFPRGPDFSDFPPTPPDLGI